MQRAPLPVYWSAGEDGASGQAHLPATVDGLYGHGFSEPIATALGGMGASPCQGDQAARDAVLSRLGPYRLEFWLYATAKQGVLFVRAADVDTAKACSETVTYSYEMQRAFVADGLVHSFDVNDEGDVQGGGTRLLSANDREYSGSFDMLHNLMSRGRLRKTKRHSHQTVGGFSARCAGSPGLVWSTTCQSEAPGLAHGMIVYAAAGDDEREMFHLELDELRPHATLDAQLFDVGRSWHSRSEEPPQDRRNGN